MTEKMEDILDLCIEEARAGRDPEAVLRRHPEVADEIRPLLNLTAELRRLPAPQSTGGGVMQALAHLANEQAEETANPRAPKASFFSLPVMWRVAAAVLIVLFLGWSTATASAGAVPGDFLYPVKLLTERVKFFMTVNAEDRAELRIVFSEERLKEALRTHQRGGGVDKELLRAMLDEARLALDAAPELPEITTEFLSSRVSHLSEFQKAMLEHMQKRATPEEKETLQPFVDMCNMRCDWMRRMPQPRNADQAPSETGPCTRMRRWMDSCPDCR